MLNLLRTECYKLFHSGAFWGIGLFYLLLGSILLLDSSGNTTHLFRASLYNVPLLYFLQIVFCAVFVGDDFGRGTLQVYLEAGHKRGAVIFIKMLVYQAACMFISGVTLLLHGLAGGLFLQKMDFEGTGLFLTIAVTGIAVVSMCMLPFFFAVIFRDVGKTLAVSMILFFLMIFFMNGEQAQILSRFLPMGQVRWIALEGKAALGTEAIGADLAAGLLLYVGAHMVFLRLDLK